MKATVLIGGKVSVELVLLKRFSRVDVFFIEVKNGQDYFILDGMTDSHGHDLEEVPFENGKDINLGNVIKLLLILPIILELREGD